MILLVQVGEGNHFHPPSSDLSINVIARRGEHLTARRCVGRKRTLTGETLQARRRLDPRQDDISVNQAPNASRVEARPLAGTPSAIVIA
jgi:hypothetical protein